MKKPSRMAARAIIALLCIALSGGLLAANLSALAENAAMPNLQSANAPPIADNLEFTTFRDIPVMEKLSAVDPDGDAMTYEIITPPKKGTVTADENGAFVYTPKEGYKGKDSFVYVAVDTMGNISSKATVKITVKKQTSKTTYADMDGNDAAYAALVLSENGVFTGEALGGEHFFKPDEPVTRGEFLAMCLKACGAETLPGITRTGFSDDDSIPTWAKPYVSTALMSGIISGYKDTDGQLVFSPDAPVTFSEAAVILNNILDLTDVVSVAAIEADPEIPVWAYTAAANLSAYSVIPQGVTDIYNENVTRAGAAKMLLSAGQLLESGTSLLSWAK